MARTTQDYLDLMRHALGKTPQARHKLIDTLNDAGRALVTAHTWTWRTSRPTMLPIPAGQEYVVLPADFGQVVSIYTKNSQLFRVMQTSLDDIGNRRNWDDFDPGVLYISFDGSDTQITDDQSQPHRRAEIYPAQDTARNDVEMIYLRTWVDLTEANNSAVPNIPPEFERSLVLFARAFAVDIENQVEPYERQALFGPSGEIGRLMMEDANRQRTQGRPQHSVTASSRSGYRYPHRRIGF